MANMTVERVNDHIEMSSWDGDGKMERGGKKKNHKIKSIKYRQYIHAFALFLFLFENR